MNNAFLYCLIEAALKFSIHVILPQMMSNHHHTTVYDRDGNVVDVLSTLPHQSRSVCERTARPVGKPVVERADQPGRARERRRCE
jgi:hypothetical protein